MRVLGLLHSFDASCQARKLTRRRLLRFIRINYHLIKDVDKSGWLSRKIDRNYMVDLTDDHVKQYVSAIIKKTGGEVEHNKSIL